MLTLLQYSSAIFVQSGFTRKNALLVSLGTGVVNWLFAIPAIYTIDTFRPTEPFAHDIPIDVLLPLLHRLLFLDPGGCW